MNGSKYESARKIKMPKDSEDSGRQRNTNGIEDERDRENDMRRSE